MGKVTASAIQRWIAEAASAASRVSHSKQQTIPIILLFDYLPVFAVGVVSEGRVKIANHHQHECWNQNLLHSTRYDADSCSERGKVCRPHTGACLSKGVPSAFCC